MRNARIRDDQAANYHVMSRVVDRRWVFNDDEKERFLQIMRAAEAFCGVEIVTHSVLGNHFRIVLHVPDREDVRDGLFRSRFLHSCPRSDTSQESFDLSQPIPACLPH